MSQYQSQVRVTCAHYRRIRADAASPFSIILLDDFFNLQPVNPEILGKEFASGEWVMDLISIPNYQEQPKIMISGKVSCLFSAERLMIYERPSAPMEVSYKRIWGRNSKQIRFFIIGNREIISTLKDAARFLGFSRMSLYRYRQMYPWFPPLPTFKIAIQNWKQKWNLPRKRGPQPSQRRKQVVYLREEEGLTFEEIAKEVGVSRAEAWMLWDRHLKSQKGRDRFAGLKMPQALF